MAALCQWEVVSKNGRQSAGVFLHGERAEATECWQELKSADPASGWYVRRVREGDPKFRKQTP